MKILKKNTIILKHNFNITECNENINYIINVYDEGYEDLLSAVYSIQLFIKPVESFDVPLDEPIGELTIDEIINNNKIISSNNINYENSKNINIIYFYLTSRIYYVMKDNNKIILYFETMFTCSLLISFMNNILYNKKEACYIHLFLEDNKELIKSALIKACDNIDKMGFSLDIFFICPEEDKDIYLKNNSVFKNAV